MSFFRIALLMTVLTVLLVMLGGLIGGETGAFIALIVSAVMNFGSYWFSDKMVLKMYRAQEITESQAPDIFHMVRHLTTMARIPMPRLYIIDDPTPNAFATGRNPENSAVAVTSGLLEITNSHELEGVIAHELAHIRNRDILISSFAATLAGAISMLAQIGQWSLFFGGNDDEDGNPLFLLLGLILMPIAATMVQMAVSRSREFTADETAAQLTKNPMGLASALQRLEEFAGRRQARVNPATAHMFIINPLKGMSFSRLFSTHPPTEERIYRLEQMAGMRRRG